MHDHVGDDAALLVQLKRSFRRPTVHAVDVLRHQRVQEALDIGPGELDDPALRQMQHADPAADRGIFELIGVKRLGDDDTRFRGAKADKTRAGLFNDVSQFGMNMTLAGTAC